MTALLQDFTDKKSLFIQTSHGILGKQKVNMNDAMALQAEVALGTLLGTSSPCPQRKTSGRHCTVDWLWICCWHSASQPRCLPYL